MSREPAGDLRRTIIHPFDKELFEINLASLRMEIDLLCAN